MLISCEMGEEQSIFSKLNNIPEIKNCLITFGSYDIVAEFETKSPNEMNDTIRSKIRTIHNIKSTITLRVSN